MARLGLLLALRVLPVHSLGLGEVEYDGIHSRVLEGDRQRRCQGHLAPLNLEYLYCPQWPLYSPLLVVSAYDEEHAFPLVLVLAFDQVEQWVLARDVLVHVQ